MTFHNSDYRIDQLINQRQDEIRHTSRQSRQPSALRVRAGMTLIALGERLRGCAPVAPAPTTTRRVHTTPRVAA
ncbi:MAG TPA: hypothetical protein VNZ55_03070 [Thermomicrobiales bacterium]|nr:hypothetical protein [Thermomicrobiales bacterium]